MTISLLTAAVLAGAFLIGMVPPIVDGIKEPLRARLALTDGRLAWFLRLFYLAWLPGMPLAGWILDSWHVPREILFFGQLGLILGFTCLALARSPAALGASVVALGLAYSCVATTAVRLMTSAFFPADAHEQFFGASLNLGFISVGAGALIGPAIVRGIERLWGCRQGLLYLSVGCLGPAMVTVFCDRSLFPRPADSLAGVDDMLGQPQMALLAGAMLLYFALESCLDYWPDAYLKDLGYQSGGARFSLLIFWLAFIGTRGLAAWWLYEHPGQTFALTLILLVFSAIVLGNLTGGYEVGGGTLGIWLVGACYGPLLPGFLALAMAQAEKVSDKPLPAALLGGLLALSGLDTLLVRPLMNKVGKDRPARFAMRIPTVLAIVLAVPLLLAAFL